MTRQQHWWSHWVCGCHNITAQVAYLPFFPTMDCAVRNSLPIPCSLNLYHQSQQPSQILLGPHLWAKRVPREGLSPSFFSAVAPNPPSSFLCGMRLVRHCRSFNPVPGKTWRSEDTLPDKNKICKRVEIRWHVIEKKLKMLKMLNIQLR